MSSQTSRVDRVALRLRARRDPAGELARRRRVRAVDEEALLLRERDELAAAVELLRDEDRAGRRVDRRLRVLGEAVERRERLAVVRRRRRRRAALVSQRSRPRTSTKRFFAIIGTVRVAPSTLSTSVSPAVNLSWLKSARPPASAAFVIAATT